MKPNFDLASDKFVRMFLNTMFPVSERKGVASSKLGKLRVQSSQLE